MTSERLSRAAEALRRRIAVARLVESGVNAELAKRDRHYVSAECRSLAREMGALRSGVGELREVVGALEELVMCGFARRTATEAETEFYEGVADRAIEQIGRQDSEITELRRQVAAAAAKVESEDRCAKGAAAG